MIEWYIDHVYVLPWWAYASALYVLVGCFSMRVAQMVTPELDNSVFLLGWPLMGTVWLCTKAVRASAWLLGFRDAPPTTIQTFYD
jgi:hypothetical protein